MVTGRRVTWLPPPMNTRNTDNTERSRMRHHLFRKKTFSFRRFAVQVVSVLKYRSQLFNLQLQQKEIEVRYAFTNNLSLNEIFIYIWQISRRLSPPIDTGNASGVASVLHVPTLLLVPPVGSPVPLLVRGNTAQAAPHRSSDKQNPQSNHSHENFLIICWHQDSIIPSVCLFNTLHVDTDNRLNIHIKSAIRDVWCQNMLVYRR